MIARGSGKLKVTLQGDREILFTRTFAAPRELVFEVLTEPEHVRRWWCCIEGFTMPICEIDLRVGGRWRFVMVAPDGSEIGFRGEYLELARPTRIVNTEIFEPYPDNPSVVTLTLEEVDGITHYRALQIHDTPQARDAHVASGMEAGADLSLDRVEELARELASR
jgi:uncharacterized protein YndB with AHSA1/START domain